ncbi:uncharacterized protein BT62DRAFT_1008760 [Guyanagaster necrorhizus]|uniref:Uncharacterized protein n=1 Tax=Guyanagaster necrorhizus TaxID=856835 RepID=A0A9P8AQC6_9AGAR|nr:uncharacterized protein BT62DRAFT_1008760 [Guyanagaster necrorhizus MCA 3950]KAG7443706.1 hypothetical protein BT62DRAFT_1008760 [Guyanagaster necrorhizus MCA 3950]
MPAAKSASASSSLSRWLYTDAAVCEVNLALSLPQGAVASRPSIPYRLGVKTQGLLRIILESQWSLETGLYSYEPLPADHGEI